MDKKEIKIKLKEGITAYLQLVEANKKSEKSEKKEKSDNKDGPQKGTKSKSGKKEYADVQRSFKKLGGPSMVDIMIMTGIPDDDKGTNRSLFRKKVLQKKNKDTGSYYQFDDEELAKVRAAIDSQ